MNNNRIEDISVFHEFSTLEKIWLCGNLITDIYPIAANKGLVELGFNNCLIENISALRGMNKLELLCLYNCGIEDISALSGCTSLNELHMEDNNISDYSPLDGLNITDLYI